MRKLIFSLIIVLALAGTVLGTLIITTGGPVRVVDNKALVGHWLLDSTSGAKDLTPNGNHGTGAGGITIGGATDQHGQASRATTFDGTNDYVDVGNNNSVQIVGALTISAWVKVTDTNAHQNFVGKDASNDRGYSLNLRGPAGADNKVTLFISSSATVRTARNSSSDLIYGVWTHIVGVYSPSSNQDVYINGVLNNGTIDAAIPATMFNSTQNLLIGNSGFNEFLLGSLFDVRVYNRALSATEVTSLYNSYRPVCQISSLYKGLVLDMPLAQQDLKSATTIADKTPYDNTGTLVGSPTFTTDKHGQADKAMSFNGTTQYVELANSSRFNTLANITVSAWINQESMPSSSGIFELTDSDQTGDSRKLWEIIALLGTGCRVLIFNSGSTILQADLTFTNNAWHHIVIATGSGGTAIYVDGSTSGVSYTTGSVATNAAPKQITNSNLMDKALVGARYFSSALQGAFDGSIHSVKVWDRALNAGEVGDLYALSY